MVKGVEKRRINRKSRFLCWLIMLLQLGAAVGLILTIRYHLGSAELVQSGKNTTVKKTACKMSTASASSLCVYGFVVGGVSFIWTILLGIFLLVTCGCCGCGEWLEMFFALLGCVWWAIPVAIFTFYGIQANRNTPPIPGKGWRWAAQIFAYIGFVLFAVHLLLALLRAARNAYNKGRASADMEAGRPGKYSTQTNPQQGQFVTSDRVPPQGAPLA